MKNYEKISKFRNYVLIHTKKVNNEFKEMQKSQLK